MFMVCISTNCVPKRLAQETHKFANVAFETSGSRSTRFTRMNFVFETTGPKNKNVKGISLIEQRVDLVTSSESLINSNIIL